MIDPRRGVLYPARMPEFHRLPPPPIAAELVTWFWIPEWDIAPGRSSRQDVVAYPALNLVVEPSRVELVGATTKATFRDLTGRSWAVGALLRPAAVAALVEAPNALRDDVITLDAPDLLDAVSEVMATGEGRRERAVATFASWLSSKAGAITPTARLANELSDLLMSDDAILSPEDAAARLSMSVRTLQRLAYRYVGLSPSAMIRRRRLQEAAQRMRDEPEADLARIAAELGYADHSHLTNDFRAALGIAPRAYRGAEERAGRPPESR